MFDVDSEKFLEKIGWIIRFGIPKRKISAKELRYEGLNIIDRPVFFLSTGRVGTQWFSKLLKKDSKVRAFHEPAPSMFFQWREIMKRRSDILNKEDPCYNIFRELFIATRLEYLRYSYKTDKRYIETNHYLTFFAPIIADLIPSALFVHVYRHPIDYIISGLRRGWYKKEFDTFLKPEIKNIPNNFHSTRENKIAWLWSETNAFIEDFKSNVSKERVYEFNFDDINDVAVIGDLIQFLGLSIPRKKILRFANKKFNAQKVGKRDILADWDDIQKNEVKLICGELLEKYGYEINI